MPTFDVVSEVDHQEVRNAVDQARREIDTRFDFKNTNSSIEQNDLVLTLRTVSEDRLTALRVVLEERLVNRGVSLKGVDYGTIEEATQNTVRQVVTIKVGISSDKAREVNKLIKEKHPERRQHPDPGRFRTGQRQEARRPPGRDRHPEGHRPRHPPPVQQLPRLTESAPRRLGCRTLRMSKSVAAQKRGTFVGRVGDQTLWAAEPCGCRNAWQPRNGDVRRTSRRPDVHVADVGEPTQSDRVSRLNQTR